MSHLTIALDIMGGDYGPRSTIPAAVDAVSLHSNLHLILCGNEHVIRNRLDKLDALGHPRLHIHHCDQVVNNDDDPAFALRHKKDASMRVALDLVKQGKASAAVSSGNTGALFAMARYVLKLLPGVKKPALISTMPTKTPRPVFLLDLGANLSCDGDTLYQFGLMGNVIAKSHGISKPRISLLNIGSEDIKGHQHIKLAAQQMQANESLNYIGYSEGHDIFSGNADVIVCEGFVGNVALKTGEGIAKLLMFRLQKALKKKFLYRFLAFLFVPVLKKLIKRVNPDQYNGASLVGLRGIVVKSHGNASNTAFLAAINEAVREVERQLPEKIQHTFENLVKEHA